MYFYPSFVSIVYGRVQMYFLSKSEKTRKSTRGIVSNGNIATSVLFMLFINGKKMPHQRRHMREHCNSDVFALNKLNVFGIPIMTLLEAVDKNPLMFLKFCLRSTIKK